VTYTLCDKGAGHDYSPKWVLHRNKITPDDLPSGVDDNQVELILKILGLELSR
jgi:hypothetical protein